jgi:hypothetical protein
VYFHVAQQPILQHLHLMRCIWMAKPC